MKLDFQRCSPENFPEPRTRDEYLDSLKAAAEGGMVTHPECLFVDVNTNLYAVAVRLQTKWGPGWFVSGNTSHPFTDEEMMGMFDCFTVLPNASQSGLGFMGASRRQH